MHTKKYIVSLLIIPLCVLGCGENTSSNANTVQNQNTAAPTKEAVYTLTMVEEHASENDCWLVIENVVYDVTAYIAQHPGKDRILEGCGKDATDLFTGTSTVGRAHSAVAKKILENYRIGTLQ